VIAGTAASYCKRVERVHDRLRLALVLPCEERREGVALQEIPGIDQHDSAGILRPQRLEDRRGARQAAWASASRT